MGLLKNNRWICRLIAVVALLFSSSVTLLAETTESIRQRSVDYVLSHPEDCTVTHGYRCQSTDESHLLLNPQQSVPATYLLAWPVAYEDFQSLETLSEMQKDLHHYRVGFAENEHNIIIILTAVLLPELDEAGAPNGRLLRSTLGRSMRYEIDRHSLDIVLHQYYR